MNGIFNNNFLMGFLLAKDLPRNEQFTMGLAAGQSKTIVGPLLLKPQIDTRVDLEAKNTTLQTNINTIQGELATTQIKVAEAQKELDVLRRAFAIRVSAPTTAGLPVTLEIPTGLAANWRFGPGQALGSAALTSDGKLTIPKGTTGNVDILVDDGGFTRKLTLAIT